MQRKILAICGALVALGVLAIAPAGASAATTIQDTSGGATVSLAQGAKITAYSTKVSKLTGSGLTVECNENILTGSIHKNDGNEVQATIEDAWFQSNLNSSGTKCKSSVGEATITIPGLTNGSEKNRHWCIRTVPNTNEWELWGNNCTTEVGTGELTFIVDTPLGECKFKRTLPVVGTFSTPTNHTASELVMTGTPIFTLEAGNFFCPKEGSLEEMKFDLFTDPGTSSTYVDPTVAPNPVWLRAEV
jgi:hypothetical protein